ncbi:MAG: hypothetical protein Q8900_00430 [Bacillota bacterium]|nr:hypothetical protein [Bacillota bacterium]
MKLLISIIIDIKDIIKDNIHQYGWIKGCFRSCQYIFIPLLCICSLIGIPFTALSFIFKLFSPDVKYHSLMMVAGMSNMELTIGIIITEIGLLLYIGIYLLNNKIRQIVMACICVSVLTLGGIFIAFDGIDKYCYIKENKNYEQFVIAARYGLLSEEIFYEPSDIDFVKISDEISYEEKVQGKSTILTGPYQSYNFKIYLKNNKCLEMQALKSDNCDYLYEYLTQNNVPIVYEGKTKLGINVTAKYTFLGHI